LNKKIESKKRKKHRNPPEKNGRLRQDGLLQLIPGKHQPRTADAPLAGWLKSYQCYFIRGVMGILKKL